MAVVRYFEAAIRAEVDFAEATLVWMDASAYLEAVDVSNRPRQK